MSYKPRRERRAAGGKAVGAETRNEERGNLYNAKGSPAADAIDAKSDGFKRGGKAKRADGGPIEGEGAKASMGKRARGGAAEREEEDREERAAGGAVGRARGGAAPFSSAHNIKPPSSSSTNGPGEQAKTIR